MDRTIEVNSKLNKKDIAKVVRHEKEHVIQISNICAQQNWVDYNPSKTSQQVESIVMKGYPHHSCSSLHSEGFCIGKCKYYDGSGDVL